MENQTLEQLSYGIAFEKFISIDNDYQGTPFEKYQFLVECVSNHTGPEDWVAWQPFENLEWPDVLANIEDEAESILANFRHVLKNVKAGIVAGAIDGTLVHDYRDLDLNHMFMVGQSSES